MKIVTVVGARPQFVKAAVVSRAFQKHAEVEEIMIHTGQHFDRNMSDVFFEEMQLPKPDYFLNINRLGHGAMTGQMLEKIEAVLSDEKPDWVLVYGDTNSTLAGALAAKKLDMKVAHVEAGLRSFNLKMPEEINRILTDRISDVLFCPTDTAVENLHREGFCNFPSKIVKTGDVMFDAALFYAAQSERKSTIVPRLRKLYPTFDENNFILCTIHRQENTTQKQRLEQIFKAISAMSRETSLVLPLHPGTKKQLERFGIKPHNAHKLIILEPLGYFDIIQLLKNANFVMTDSGGMQKEAYFFKKPCLTLRDQTEWVELTDAGVNFLCEANCDKIMLRFKELLINKYDFSQELYGSGDASGLIAEFFIKN